MLFGSFFSLSHWWSYFLKFELETRASWPVFDERFKIGLPFKLVSIVPWPFITG